MLISYKKTLSDKKINKFNNETSCAFTVCAWNYLAFSLTLSESFVRHHPNLEFYIFIADKYIDLKISAPKNVTIILIDEDIVPDLYRMAAIYTILELNTSVKAHCFEYLFDEIGYHKVVYLDPDIFITHPFRELFDSDLRDYDCIITPHITTPIEDGLFPDNFAFMRAGIYNLGFVGFNNNPEARKFISWWRSCLETECFVAIERGIFVDQKYCDFIPAFIAKTKIQRDPGYNLAYWNLVQRKLTFVNGRLHASGSIVKFIHFSGIDINNPDIFSRHQNRYNLSSIGNLQDVYEKYLTCVVEKNHFSSIEYGYNHLRDGTLISKEMRECFRIYWSDINVPKEVFSVGPQFFNKPSRLTAVYDLSPVNRLVAEIYKARKDLQEVFDVTQASGRRLLNNWALASLKREYNVADEYGACNEDHKFDREELKNDFDNQSSLYNNLNRLLKVYMFYLKSLFLFGRFKENELDDAAWNFAYSFENIPLVLKRSLLKYLQVNINLERKKLIKHWLNERGIHEFPELHLSDYHINHRVVVDAEPGIDIYGFFNTETGVGQAARDLSNAIDGIGIKNHRHSINPLGFANSVIFNSDKNMQSSYSSALLVLNADNILNLNCFLNPQIIEKNHKIGFFFWELPVFPAVWRESCEYVDEIWVPSNFSVQSLSSATRKSIKLVPLPVKVNCLDKFEARKRLNLPNDRIIFLTIFDYNSFPERKNPLATLRAFIDAFPENIKEGPILIIKCHGILNRGAYEHELIKYSSKCHNVYILDMVYEREEILNLQAACDVFVSLHRSEGFGLNLAECMAAKKLTIATNYSGNTDFMNDKNSILIDYKLRELREGEYVHWQGQSWAEPDHECAVEAFRLAAASEAIRISMGELAQESIATTLSYSSVGKTILKLIARHEH